MAAQVAGRRTQPGHEGESFTTHVGSGAASQPG